MKLSEDFVIERKMGAFVLRERKDVHVMKDGEETGEIKDGYTDGSYGTLYQALSGYLVKATQRVDVLDDVSGEIKKVLDDLIDAKEEIKKHFSIIVRVEK